MHTMHANMHTMHAVHATQIQLKHSQRSTRETVTYASASASDIRQQRTVNCEQLSILD